MNKVQVSSFKECTNNMEEYKVNGHKKLEKHHSITIR